MDRDTLRDVRSEIDRAGSISHHGTQSTHGMRHPMITCGTIQDDMTHIMAL